MSKPPKLYPPVAQRTGEVATTSSIGSRPRSADPASGGGAARSRRCSHRQRDGSPPKRRPIVSSVTVAGAGLGFKTGSVASPVRGLQFVLHHRGRPLYRL